MTLPSPKKRKINFLFSDTGGGHRSSALAIIEALEIEYPGLFESRLIDIFHDYAPIPFRDAPRIYPQLTRAPRVWEAGYRISNSPRKAGFIHQIAWPYVRRGAQQLVKQNPCDLFVSVHPLANQAYLNITVRHSIPFATVVTDMVSVHAFWFDPRADLVIVPTESARQTGIAYGMSAERIRVAGQPVAEQFRSPAAGRQHLKTRLGWNPDLPVILLVGGGEGMGPVERIAYAIDEAKLPAHLVIITGRNQTLLQRLKTRAWQMPVSLYGFVRNMPELMAASDILVSKAGPGTISEAFIAGLPIVLYSRLPGQEEGNVSYVTESKAGVWAPEPGEAVMALRMWLNYPSARAEASQASQKMAQPDATRKIARLLKEQFFSNDHPPTWPGSAAGPITPSIHPGSP